MKELYISKMLDLLEKKERENVYKIASSNGFRVEGFRNLNIAPLPKIISALKNKNKKEKLFSTIMLEAIVEFSSVVSEKNESINKNKEEGLFGMVAELCLKNEIGKEERIEDLLKQIEEVRLEPITKNKMNEPDINEEEYWKSKLSDANNEIDSLRKQINNLGDENNKLREKNNVIERRIKDLKITSDNKDKYIKQIEKEMMKLQEDYKGKEEFSNELKEKYDNLKDIIYQLENTIEEQADKINDLAMKNSHYTRKRVLCFSLKKISIDRFEEYEIEMKHSWNDKELQQIIWNKYDYVWIVTQDVPFGAIRQIQKLSNIPIKTYYSIKKLYEICI